MKLTREQYAVLAKAAVGLINADSNEPDAIRHQLLRWQLIEWTNFHPPRKDYCMVTQKGYEILEMNYETDASASESAGEDRGA